MLLLFSYHPSCFTWPWYITSASSPFNTHYIILLEPSLRGLGSSLCRVGMWPQMVLSNFPYWEFGCWVNFAWHIKVKSTGCRRSDVNTLEWMCWSNNSCSILYCSGSLSLSSLVSLWLEDFQDNTFKSRTGKSAILQHIRYVNVKKICVIKTITMGWRIFSLGLERYLVWAWWLRELAVFAEVLRCWYTIIYNSSCTGSYVLFWPPSAPGMHAVHEKYIHAHKTHNIN